jgi:hypothetical protein
VNGIKASITIGSGLFSCRIDIYIIQNAPTGGIAKRTTNANKMAGWLSGACPRVINRAAAAIATKPPTI